MTLIMAAKDTVLFWGTNLSSREEFNLGSRAQLNFGWVLAGMTTVVKFSNASTVITELVFSLFLNMYIESEKKIIYNLDFFNV